MNIVAFALSLFTAIASGVQTLFDVNAAGWARSIAPAPVLGAGLAIMTAALLGLLGGGMALTRRERAPFVLSVDAGLCALALLGGVRAGAIWAALYLISAVVARVDMGSLDEGGEEGGVARLGAGRVLRAIHVFLESPMDAQGRVRILPDEGGEALIGIDTGALIRRAFLFLEDGDFARADLYLEQALTQDPEEPRAYLGKLMAELGAHSVDELATWPVPFDGERSFQRALRFSSPGERERLEGLASAALDRLDRRRAEERAELEDRYERALALRETATTGRDLAELTELLSSLGEYKDAPELAQEAGREAELEERYEQALAMRARARTSAELDEALALLSSIEGYKDVDEILAGAELEKEYLGALALKERARGEDELDRAAELLEGLGDYRDAEGQAQDARRLAKEARRALRAAIARREVLKRWGLRLAWIAVLSGFLALGGGRWVAGLFGYVPANDASWPPPPPPIPTPPDASQIDLARPSGDIAPPKAQTPAPPAPVPSAPIASKPTPPTPPPPTPSTPPVSVTAVPVTASRDVVLQIGISRRLSPPLYERPSTGAPRLGQIPADWSFPVVEVREDAAANMWWLRVSSDVYGRGWAPSDGIMLDRDAGSVQQLTSKGEVAFNAMWRRALGPAAPTPPDVAAPPMRPMRVSGNRVNLRSEPNTSSRVLARLYKGDELQADPRSLTDGDGQSWWRVRTDKGLEGWVSSRYVQDR